MINILSKIFKNKDTQNYYSLDFENLSKKTKIEKIFNLISNYSPSSEIRYVGGSIRKIINKENVDDIDLATNVTPKECL
jgi:tRNA nucleotidyltransferase/poly(A) polymerase